jgi:rod shape-determining protein MreC
MPVVTPQGLVGRVTSVGIHWSKVLLIIDPSSSVSAVVQSTRATGVVRGVTGDPNGSLVMKYVPQGEAIKVGDVILTSGLGGNFPKRLVIGEVIKVYKQDIELFQEAVIKPSVDFTRLEFVMVLKNYTPADITSEPTPTPTPTPRPTRTPVP